MNRFTAIALACLLALPAKATDCPIPTAYPEIDSNFDCISLRCHGLRLLRAAHKRGEITTVHLSRLSECQELSWFDPATGEQVAVPCTYDHNDTVRPY